MLIESAFGAGNNSDRKDELPGTWGKVKEDIWLLEKDFDCVADESCFKEQSKNWEIAKETSFDIEW